MTRHDESIDIGALVVAASAVVVLIGAVLPWVDAAVLVLERSLSGIALFTESSPIFNGVVTVVLAAIATVLAVAADDRKGIDVLVAIVGGLIVLIALAFVGKPEAALGGGIVGEVGARVSTSGSGVYVTMIGGLGIVVGAMLAYRD